MLKSLDIRLINFYKSLKKIKNKSFTIILKPFSNLGICADLISFIGLFFGILSAIFIHISYFQFIVYWTTARILDMFDGTMAKLNNRKILKNINVDYLCDNIITITFFITSIPLIGYTIPILTTILYLIHLKVALKFKGKNLFVPRGDYSQFLFFFKKYKLGMILQITCTLLFLALFKISNKNNKI